MTNQPESAALIANEQEPARFFPEEPVPQIERIGRIGKRLFGVPHCIVMLKDGEGGAAGESAETEFCREQAVPDDIHVVPDTAIDQSMYRHRYVKSAPFIRFYAAHPIFGANREPSGSICLVDSVPHMFSKDDRLMLADLAAMVQRELQMQSMNAFQLDLQRKNKNLRRQSLVDPLLGIWNRGAIMRILTIEAARCDKVGLPLSLIVADLDHFKRINDTYGHPAGDAVLTKVATKLRSCIRPQEALGRYGGEEFLIVLPGAAASTATAVAERMRQAISAQPESIGSANLQLTISLGVASTDFFQNLTTDELISKADVALYAAKDAGRNRVVQAH